MFRMASLSLVGLALLAAPVAAQQPDRWRQYGVSRPMAEQDRALMQREQGQIRSLNDLMPRAQRAVGGASRYLGVEPSEDGLTYRFKFQRPDGRLVWVDMDGRTASVLSVR